jgi:hypothetical protein
VYQVGFSLHVDLSVLGCHIILKTYHNTKFWEATLSSVTPISSPLHSHHVQYHSITQSKKLGATKVEWSAAA